jgi:predicted permease
MRSAVRSLLRALTRRTQLEEEMSAELRFHMDAHAEDLVRAGVPPDEARRRAAIAFGSVERTRQECRESRGLRWPDEFVRNVRYALRTLRRSPGFSIAAILTLALGIGANTAIFSVIDAALLRPLPYPDPDRLVEVVRQYRARGSSGIETSQDGAAWELLRDHSRLLDYAAMGPGWNGVNLATNGKAQYVAQQRVSAGYFRVLGLVPARGREFTREEDRDGGPAAVILSHDLWMRLFNADPGIVGRTVLLRGEPHVVAGVMPADFRPIVHTDVWTPLRPSTKGEGSGQNYHLIARLRPGVSIEQGSAEVQSLGERLLEGRKLPPDSWVRFGVVPLARGLADDIRKPLYILWIAVALVLLIGCLNIAGLMLVRAAGRTREIATRVALGGGQGAVLRQLLTESLVVAALGGLAGVALGYAGIRGLAVFVQDALGVWQELRLDWRVLAATAAISVVTSLLFGLMPALKAARLDVRTGLVEGSRGVAGGTSRWPRRLLVFGEVALGMVLLVGAGLMIRTFFSLRQQSPGFDGTNVLTANLSLQDARYGGAEQVNRLFTESLERIRALPGVESAAVGLTLPYERWLNMGFLRADQVGTGARTTITGLNYVTPGYFRALRIPLLGGRVFEDRDQANSAPVAIVNQAFADRYLKDRQVIGNRLVVMRGAPREVVGVVGNLQQRPGWGSNAPLAEQPAMYVPASQVTGEVFQLVHTWFAPKWVVRASGPTQSLAAGMRAAVEAVDPLLPFRSFQSLVDIRDRSLLSQRVEAILLGSFAGLALLLAAIGVYALIANSVAQRTREIGIRMALGASLGRLIWNTAMPGIALAATGVVVGSLAAAWAIAALRSAVYGISRMDPPTVAAVAAILLLVAVVASLLPALRMARFNPAATLRDE